MDDWQYARNRQWLNSRCGSRLQRAFNFMTNIILSVDKIHFKYSWTFPKYPFFNSRSFMSGLVNRGRIYGPETAIQDEVSKSHTFTLKDQLAERKARAQREIERVERIEQLLNANPDVEELMNLLG